MNYADLIFKITDIQALLLNFLDKKQKLNYNCENCVIKFLKNIEISEFVKSFDEQKKLEIFKKMGWEVNEEFTEEQKLKIDIIFDNIDIIFKKLIEKKS
jgi:hypothetical protein